MEKNRWQPTCWLLLLLLLNGSIGSVLAAKQAPTPSNMLYRNAEEQLGEGDFDAALGWFATVKKQMPGTTSSLKASVHRALIFAARELSSLVLSKDYLAGKKLSVVVGDKGVESAFFETAFDNQVQVGRQAAADLLKEVTDLLREDDGRALDFSFSFPLTDLNVEKVRDLVRKGEMPDREKQTGLARGVFVGHYLNLVSEVLAIPTERMRVTPFVGQVHRRKLFLVLGSRLSLVADVQAAAAQGIMFGDAALSCFKKVIALSPKGKFDRDRLRAEEEKKKIIAGREKLKASIDPRCFKKMQADWRYCPWDGTPLSALK